MVTCPDSSCSGERLSPENHPVFHRSKFSKDELQGRDLSLLSFKASGSQMKCDVGGQAAIPLDSN